MADKGPLLTSCVIFYLSIGAAFFQILEEPNWKTAKSNFKQEKQNILKRYTCLNASDLDYIFQVVSDAAGQGISIIGDRHIDYWDWANSVTFAATIVTTIGYGNVAPKTVGGRLFCIFYGLCGIPLCLVWISELGSFFGDRAKRLSQVLIRKGISVKKVQFTCTALFLLWGLLVHLVIPPCVFMSLEEWSYLEGLYFSFITLTTVGFGDYVAGANPNIEYPRLYKVFAQLWIYMGLAWLSLFFSWNVHMVVEAHKVLKKRRQKNKSSPDEPIQSADEIRATDIRPTVVDIFNFLSEKDDDYSSVIKDIGVEAKKRKELEEVSRSKSCSDILADGIRTLDQSPPRRRRLSISEMFIRPKAANDSLRIKKNEGQPLIPESKSEPTEIICPIKITVETVEDNQLDSEEDCGIVFGPVGEVKEEGHVPNPDGGLTRFTVHKVGEEDLQKEDTDEKG